MDRRKEERRSGEERRKYQSESVKIQGLKGWWKIDSGGIHHPPTRAEDKEANDDSSK